MYAQTRRDGFSRPRFFAVLLIAVVITFASGEISRAADKTFTTDGQIVDGDLWDNVYITNNATVNMYGGDIGGDGTYGGPNIYIQDSGTLNFYGGHLNYGILYVGDDAVVNIYDVDILALDLFLSAYGSSTVNIYGISSPDYYNWFSAWGSSTINVHGYDLGVTYYYDEEIDISYDIVYGKWSNGSPFEMYSWTDGSIDHVNLIPEPATLALLGLGGVFSLFFKRRKLL